MCVCILCVCEQWAVCYQTYQTSSVLQKQPLCSSANSWTPLRTKVPPALCTTRASSEAVCSAVGPVQQAVFPRQRCWMLCLDQSLLLCNVPRWMWWTNNGGRFSTTHWDKMEHSWDNYWMHLIIWRCTDSTLSQTKYLHLGNCRYRVPIWVLNNTIAIISMVLLSICRRFRTGSTFCSS